MGAPLPAAGGLGEGEYIERVASELIDRATSMEAALVPRRARFASRVGLANLPTRLLRSNASVVQYRGGKKAKEETYMYESFVLLVLRGA